VTANWPIPLRFGPWLLSQRLAVSAMSEVWLGHRADDATPCAVKRVLPIHRNDATILGLFQHEIRVMQRLDDVHLPRLLSHGEARGVPWLAMPFYRGASLRTLLAMGPLAVEPARWLMAELADALAAVHRAGLVHADVSPDNVHICADGEVLLLDFGIAVEQGSTAVLRRGKACYASTEQVAGAPLTAATDWFAFGRILAQLGVRDRDLRAHEADATAATAVLRAHVAHVQSLGETQVWQAAEVRGEVVTDPGLDKGATTARP